VRCRSIFAPTSCDTKQVGENHAQQKK
jgi:hypothetical protein